jgi:hypothetical protein
MQEMTEWFNQFNEPSSGDDDLTIVEHWAGDNQLISSEQEASQTFDTFIKECTDESNLHNFYSDSVMVNETFNNWMDSQCSDGYFHEEQVNSYCYCGEFAK